MKIKDLVSVVIVTKDRKKDLIECLNSYLKSTYSPLEIIVVDNASRPPLATWLPQKYPQVNLITLDTNVGAAEGRNRGLAQAKGQYILFTDDDAYAGKEMISHLVDVFRQKENAGIVQPLVYDKQKKNILQGAGHDIDLLTGRIKAWGVKEEDKGQYDGLREVPMCGCVWMVKREVFDKIGEYDEDYFIPYEDSDFSIRARKAGYKLYCISAAKTWHQGLKSTFVHPLLEWLGITSEQRAYRVSRNKLIFMSKHTPLKNFLFFLFFLEPIYIFAHSIIIILTKRFDVLLKYWQGLVSGLNYILTTRVNLMLLAWSDPLGYVIIKNPDSLLDLGCGQGKQVAILKQRTKINKVVGIDLYKPYLKESREGGNYDKLILADVTKIKFLKGSFDVVIANQVIEHLDRNDAIMLIKKMEKIAKKQVIISTPIGEIEDPPEVLENKYQKHKSFFMPKDLEKLGYKTIRYGWRWLLAPNGLAMGTKSTLLRKFFYMFNFIITPIYYLWQESCDYSFTAYKYVKR